MKSSALLVAASALLAAASPLDARRLETEVVTTLVVLTVTATNQAAEPTQTVAAHPAHKALNAFQDSLDLHHHDFQESRAPPQAGPPAPVAPSSMAAESTDVTDTTGDYKQVMLDRHNLHRDNHSANALEWDDTLARYAQNTASTCVFAHDMTQGGGQNPSYGQNLAAYGSTDDISGLQSESGAHGVTQSWYNDEMNNWRSYGQANPPAGQSLMEFGHFTQLVWASSTKVGCAAAFCEAGTVTAYNSWYHVCNYNPPGNFGGEYGTNVKPPKGQQQLIVNL